MSVRKKWCLPEEASPEGTVPLSHTPSFSNLSRISQLNIPGFSRLYSSILFSTSGVATCFSIEQNKKKMWRRRKHREKKEMRILFTINPSFPYRFKNFFIKLSIAKCLREAFVLLKSFTHPGFASTYCSRTNGAGLLVPTEDFGHAAVWDTQLSGDHAGSDAVMGHFHDFVSDVIRQWPSVDENSTELVYSTLTQRRWDCGKTFRPKKGDWKKETIAYSVR